ncbi:MAG: hypothetical protein HY769_05715 [Candidatus Stahlbacteria bacterium]|nr:hypothetical protein [Candidatus Stahlbacteria bacterium]
MSNSKAGVLYKEISQLNNNEKIVLLSKLMTEIATNIKKDIRVNFYNIKGVGKEIWKDIDAQEYVNKERESWE